MRQPQVHVTVCGQRGQHLHLAAHDARVPEQRQPARQVELRAPACAAAVSGTTPAICAAVSCAAVSRPEAGHDLRVPHVGRRGVDTFEHAPPQLRLPVEVGGHPACLPVTLFTDGPRVCRVPSVTRVLQVSGTQAVSAATLTPVGEHRGSFRGVRGEQPGQAPGHREAPPAPQFAFGLVKRPGFAEVRGDDAGPGLVDARVDGVEYRPRQLRRVPRVVAFDAEHEGHERMGREKADARAHAVGPPRRRAQPMRKPLGQPAFHAAGRNGHDLLRERVAQGLGEQIRQPVGQFVGGGAAVQVEGHDAGPPRGTGRQAGSLRGCSGGADRLMKSIVPHRN